MTTGTKHPEPIYFGDKLVPGLHNAVTIRTKTQPEAKVLHSAVVGGPGTPVKFTLTRLDNEIWKIRFLLAKDAKGEIEVSIKAGAEAASLKKPITAS